MVLVIVLVIVLVLVLVIIIRIIIIIIISIIVPSLALQLSRFVVLLALLRCRRCLMWRLAALLAWVGGGRFLCKAVQRSSGIKASVWGAPLRSLVRNV